MKEIPLTQGRIAKVDNEDFEKVAAYKWYYKKAKYGNSGHAATNINMGKGRRETWFMHTIILGITKVDHKDMDGTNNQKSNLRPANKTQNSVNSKMYSNNTSGFRGVYAHQDKWKAAIKTKDGFKHLGLFKTREEAAKEYDMKAIELHGEFAQLNFPRSQYQISSPPVLSQVPCQLLECSPKPESL